MQPLLLRKRGRSLLSRVQQSGCPTVIFDLEIAEGNQLNLKVTCVCVLSSDKSIPGEVGWDPGFHEPILKVDEGLREQQERAERCAHGGALDIAAPLSSLLRFCFLPFAEEVT